MSPYVHTLSETEEETDVDKTASRTTSGKLSVASGSVRSLSASVIGLNQRATPASQLVELEEHAAAVAAAVLMQRPQSGRDLATDAQVGYVQWYTKDYWLFKFHCVVKLRPSLKINHVVSV